MKNAMEVQRIVCILLCLVAVFYASISPIYVNDFWLQTKVGEIIFQAHTVPRTLLFPFTEISSEPFNAHEWLASLLFYGAVHIGGEAALPILQGLLGCTIFGLLVAVAFACNGRSLAWAMILALAAMWSENYRHCLRPELLALVLMLGYWTLLERLRHTQHIGAIVVLLLLVVFWSNVHGSFILAPVMTFIYLLGMAVDSGLKLSTDGAGVTRQAMLRMGSLSLLALLCTLANPFGVELLRFVWSFSTENYLREHVPEWASTWEARNSEARGFWIGMVLLALTWIAWGYQVLHRKAIGVDTLLLLAFTLLAMRSIRFVVYIGFIGAYIGAGILRTRPRKATGQNHVYGACSLFASCTLALTIQYGKANYATPLEGPPNVKFSERLVQILAMPQLYGNVLNSLELGSELVYRAYPRLKPSIDPRIDSYGLDYILFQFELLQNDALLKEFVERYDVRYILLDSVRFSTFQNRSAWKAGEWKVFYKDGKEVLLQRSDIQIPVPIY